MKYKNILDWLAVLVISLIVMTGCAEVKPSEVDNNTMQSIPDEIRYQAMMDAYKATHGNDISDNASSANSSLSVAVNSPYYGNVYISFPDGAPKVSDEKLLKVAVWSVYPDKNVSARIILPDGIELAQGNIAWSGDLSENETKVMQIIVRAVKAGDYKIGVVCSDSAQVNNSTFGKGFEKDVYALITQDSAIWSDTIPVWQPKPRVEVHHLDGSITYQTEEETRLYEEMARKKLEGYVPGAYNRQDHTFLPSK